MPTKQEFIQRSKELGKTKEETLAKMDELDAKGFFTDTVTEQPAPEQPQQAEEPVPFIKQAAGMVGGAAKATGGFLGDAVTQPMETAKGLGKGGVNALMDIGRFGAKGLGKIIPGEDVFEKAVAQEKTNIAEGRGKTELVPQGKVQERAAKVGEFGTKAGLGMGLATATAPLTAGSALGTALVGGIASNLPFVPDAFEEGGIKGAGWDMALNTALDVVIHGATKGIPIIKSKLLKKGIQGAEADKLAKEAFDQARKYIDTPQVDQAIKKGIDKGLKPSVQGKKTLQGFEQFQDKANEAVKVISLNKDKIKILNDVGEEVAQPKTAGQMAQALDQAKKLVYNEYHQMAEAAGDAGSKFDITPVVDELAKVADPNNLSLSPKARKYAESLFDELVELDGAAPAVVESRIADLNKSLAGFYDGRVAKSTAQIDASVAQLMRQQLDSQIMESTAPGYQALKNQYGALKAIEKAVNHRAVVNARGANKTLIDMTDIFTGGDLAAGLLTMNPALLAKGATQKGIKEVYKALNNPDRAIANMFKKTYGAVEKGINPPPPISMMNLGKQLAKNPLSGALVGGTTGAIAAPEGERLKGAAMGAGLGMGAQMGLKGISKSKLINNQGGFIAGMNATGFEKAPNKFSAIYDKKPRFEVSDKDAAFTSKMREKYTTPSGKVKAKFVPMEDILSHEKLYNEYPSARNIEVDLIIDKDANNSGAFIKSKGSDVPKIEIRAKNEEQAKKIALHEIQHNIQEIEGFAKGGSPARFTFDELENTPQWDKWNKEKIVFESHPKVVELNKIVKSKEYTDQIQASNRLWNEKFAKKYESLIPQNRGEISKYKKQRDAINKEYDSIVAEKFPLLKRVRGSEFDGFSPNFNKPEPKQYLSPNDKYERLGGEIESRAVSDRSNLSQSELSKTDPYASQGIPLNEIIGGRGGKAMSLSALNKNPLSNNKGAVESFSKTQQKSPNFKKWFGDWEKAPEKASKVVDAKGEPLVVYHGTNQKFNEFKKEMVGTNFNADEKGFFFTDSPKSASEYASTTSFGTSRQSDSNVLPVYVNMKKPLIKKVDFDPVDLWDNNNKAILDEAKKKGSDGIIIKADSGENMYIPLNPNQIKSATGNTGAFNPNTGDIRGATRMNAMLPTTAAVGLGGLTAGLKMEQMQKNKKKSNGLEKLTPEQLKAIANARKGAK